MITHDRFQCPYSVAQLVDLTHALQLCGNIAVLFRDKLHVVLLLFNQHAGMAHVRFQGFKPIVNRSKPIVNGLQPIVNRLKPIVNRFKSTVNRLKPIVNGLKVIVNRFKVIVNGLKLIVNRFKVIVNRFKVLIVFL